MKQCIPLNINGDNIFTNNNYIKTMKGQVNPCFSRTSADKMRKVKVKNRNV